MTDGVGGSTALAAPTLSTLSTLSTLPPPLSGPLPPDPAVLAAIVAAVQAAWPRPAAATAVSLSDELDPAHEAWRFSGRWWHKPVPMRRDRPWAGGR